jgi:GGDEF domain-containing protein
MNAAKKIRKLIESGAAEGDVAVLVDLARSLETGVPFQLSQLNALDMRNFDLAMELLTNANENEEITWLAELPHLQHTDHHLPSYPEQITVPDSLCDYDGRYTDEAVTFDQWTRIRLVRAINYHDHTLRDYAWAFQLPEITFNDAPVSFEALRENKLFRPARYGQNQSLGEIPMVLQKGLGKEIAHLDTKNNGLRYLALLADDAIRLTMEGMTFEASKDGERTNPELVAEGFATSIDFIVEDAKALASLGGALLHDPDEVADALVTALLDTRRKLIEDPVGAGLDMVLTDKPGKAIAGGIETVATAGLGAGAIKVTSWGSKQLLANLSKHLPELAERLGKTMAVLNPRRAATAARYSPEVEEMLRLAESNPDAFAQRFGAIQERLAKEVRENMLDDLTGALSRRAMMEIGPRLIDQARRAGQRLVVATFDIDNFKVLNEALGHIEGGDDALKKIVEIIREHTRAGDTLVRLEGNYATMLPEQNGLSLPTFRTSKKGDEFLVLALVDAEVAEENAKAIVRNVTHAISDRYALPAKERLTAAFERASELAKQLRNGITSFDKLSDVDKALVRLSDRPEFSEWRQLVDESLVGQISMAATVAEPGSARSLQELSDVFDTTKKRADDMLGEVKNSRKAEALSKRNAVAKPTEISVSINGTR